MLQPRTYQRGSFWVLENHVPAGHGNIKCYESVTYVTHVDFLFLDHLVPLLTRWQAPVSISVYAPGTDYQRSMEKIFFLRECLESVSNRELIKKFATFHMFFESAHFPKKVNTQIKLVIMTVTVALENSALLLKSTFRKVFSKKL